MMVSIKVKQEVCSRIPNQFGDFQLCLYSNSRDDHQHLALVLGDIRGKSDVLVRVHSECFTGETIGSQRCDCGEQLIKAMRMIADQGAGLLIYLRQEGRGIGLLEKLKAYNLQDDGMDTVEANLELGHQADQRDYSIAASIIKDLEIDSIRLMTNNPTKIEKLDDLRIHILERVGIPPTFNDNNKKYLETKAEKMNHIFEVPKSETQEDSKD